MSKQVNIDKLIKDYSGEQIGELFCTRISGKIEKLKEIQALLRKEREVLDKTESSKSSISTKIGLRMYNKAQETLKSSFSQKMKKLQGFLQSGNMREIIFDYEKADDKFEMFCDNITKNVLENLEKSAIRDSEVAKAMLEYNLLSVEKAIEQFDFHKQYFNDLKNENEPFIEG